MIRLFDYRLINYTVLLIDYTIIPLKITFTSPITNLNENKLIN